jgi:membrane-bound lytic murein transglycosylase D
VKLRLGILLALLAASCSPAAPKQARVTPPPTPIIAPQAEPVTSPVATTLQRDSRIDPIGLAIVEARVRFERGEELYKEGFMQRAKDEFDAALDLLLDTSTLYPKNARLDREISELAAKVHTLELAAFKDGDGFTNQKQEPAAIDELEHITTFPAPIDPKFKQQVEEEIAEITHDLPIEINDRVLGFLDYYQKGRGRTTIEIGLERVGKYEAMIQRILKEEGVPQDLIYLCQAESAFVPRALSRAKAKGMWQFISARGKEYGLRQNWWIDERSDPEKSTRAAARHLKDLYEEFNDWYLAMAAYNAGPYRIKRAMDKTGQTDFWKLVEKKALPKETMNYVPTILALTIINKNPEKYGFGVTPQPALEYERVPVDKATDLRVIAESINVSVDDLKTLNPHVLRWTTPPNDPEFELNIPKGLKDAFSEHVASLPENKRVLFRYHTVQRNETLSVVARKYGTTTTALSQANNLSVKKPLRVGQELMIPMSGVGPASQVASVAPKASNPSTLQKIIHKVRPGETLNKIASAYKTTVGAILSWNKKNDLTVLHPGDQITIFRGNR